MTKINEQVDEGTNEQINEECFLLAANDIRMN